MLGMCLDAPSFSNLGAICIGSHSLHKWWPSPKIFIWLGVTPSMLTWLAQAILWSKLSLEDVEVVILMFDVQFIIRAISIDSTTMAIDGHVNFGLWRIHGYTLSKQSKQIVGVIMHDLLTLLEATCTNYWMPIVAKCLELEGYQDVFL